MASLKWCANQKSGIRIVSPNANLSKEYLSNSQETLEILKKIAGRSNMWLSTTKYYCEYFAVYAVLMRLGIKSEIHECTILLVKFLEGKGIFKIGTYKILEEDKKLRIENQYYLKNKKTKFSYDDLLKFTLEIKEIINSLTENKINQIRDEVKTIIKQ